MLRACLLALLLSSPLEVMAQTAQAPVDEAAPATNDLSADQFVTLVAVSSLYEIAAGELARERVEDPALHGFAEASVRDHRQLLGALHAAVKAEEMVIEVPDRLDAGAARKLEALRSLPAEEFISRYVAEQVESRRTAAVLFSNYAEAGDLEELRRFAADLEPVLSREFEAIQQIADERPGN